MDADRTPTLKPCPFCGQAMQFRKALWPSDGCTDGINHAEPTECGMGCFDIGTTDEGVIDAWNRRAAPTDERAAFEAWARRTSRLPTLAYDAWQAWQARAALSPTPKEDTNE